MNQLREQHQYPRNQYRGTRVRLAWAAGLSATLAIASSSGWGTHAQTRSSTSLPKVTPEASVTTTQKSTNSAAVNTGGTVTSPTAATTTPSTTTTANNSPRFFCQLWNGQYTVMYSPEKRTGEAYPWATPKDLANGWTAEKRCNEISRRLEEYRPDGLQELSTSTENGYNIVCATTQANTNCRIVFTVPPGQDPLTTRDSVFQNLTVADSGTMTQGVNTFVGNSNLNLNDNLINLGLSILGGTAWRNRLAADQDINLKPYLAPSDGGTGAALRHGIRLQKGLKLRPDNFR